MKIKEVSQRTGLTEKAIRIYIENGLVHPHVESGIYRNSYTFSEENIKELEEISVFRKAGFSIFEISLIKDMPEKLPELLEKKVLSIEMEIDEKKNVKEAISRLQIGELANSSKVADALKPSLKDDIVPKEPISKRWFLIPGIVLLLTIIFISLYSKYGSEFVKIIGAFLSFLVFMASGFMTFRYATVSKRASKMENHGKGSIVSVVENHGFDASFANAGSAGAGTCEPGIGGIWQIVFMLWNEIRFDCWYPVILYKDETGKSQSASIPYGSFKNIWTVGEQIEIAWKSGHPMIVYPLDKNWVSKKVTVYGLLAIISILTFILLTAV